MMHGLGERTLYKCPRILWRAQLPHFAIVASEGAEGLIVDPSVWRCDRIFRGFEHKLPDVASRP